MTVNVSTVGSGLDFDDFAIWEAATEIDLVAAGDREEAEVHDDDTSNHAVNGATVDATNFRAAYPVAGSEWDPIAATGITLSGSAALTVNPIEDFFRISGFHIHQDAGSGACLQVNGDNTLIERCDIQMGGTNIGVRGFGTFTIRNCIIRTDSANTNLGFRVETGGAGSVIQNCVVYDWSDGVRWLADGTADTVIQNVASVDCSSDDFQFSSTALGLYTNNLSADGTEPGTSGQTQSATDAFVDPANDDFTMKAGSDCIDNGVDLSAQFTEDFNGDTRTGTWDIGVYFDAAVVSPPFLPVSIRQRRLNPIVVR